MRKFFRVRPAVGKAFFAIGFLYGLLWVAGGAFLLINAYIYSLDEHFVAQANVIISRSILERDVDGKLVDSFG